MRRSPAALPVPWMPSRALHRRTDVPSSPNVSAFAPSSFASRPVFVFDFHHRGLPCGRSAKRIASARSSPRSLCENRLGSRERWEAAAANRTPCVASAPARATTLPSRRFRRVDISRPRLQTTAAGVVRSALSRSSPARTRRADMPTGSLGVEGPTDIRVVVVFPDVR